MTLNPVVILLSLLFLAQSPATAAAPPAHWVGSWACSPQLVEPQNRPPEPGLATNTLRQIVHLTVAGSSIRLRFSNEFGATPLTLQSVHVALPASDPGAILPPSDRHITFAGKLSVTLPGGTLVFSDPLPYPVKPLSDLVVTLTASIVPDAITGHPGSRATSFLAAGDQVSAATLASPVKAEHWYLLDGVDVLRQDGASIVTLGDSITDGRGSITDQNTRWPDDLARALSADKHLTSVGVLNHGIGGNCLLRDCLGPKALARFDRDVIAQSAVRFVIVFEAVNDIGGTKAATDKGGTSTVADDVIAAYQQFILRAHTHGLRIYGATITPFGQSFYFSPSTEAARQKVNAWIRTSGQFDAVLDFDQASRDSAKPDQLATPFDSGDHLHLNSEGYRKLASAIDLKLFTP